MFEWISRNRRAEKLKAEQEASLKQSLAAKVKRFQSSATEDDPGFTRLTINGKKLRVAREHITIQALSPITSNTLA